MLNANNKIVAKSIASAYCKADTLCSSSVYNRLNNYFDDTVFLEFLSTLRNRAYLVCNFINLGYFPDNLVKINFVYFDVITGKSGSAIKILPTILFTQKRFDVILRAFEPNLLFVKQNSDNSTLFINPTYGYEIAYTTTPTYDETDTSTITNKTTGGKIIVANTSGSGTQEVIKTAVATDSFDYQSLLLPAGLAIAAYFLLVKN